jgi:hypothetical protein
MKARGRVEVQLHAFLTLTLDGGEWSASRPDRFNAEERNVSTHWIGGWVGPRRGGVEKIPLFLNSKSGRLDHSLITVLTELISL